MIYEGKAITVTALESGIVELKFDLKGESVNKFNRLTLNELRQAVDAIKADASVKGVIVSSGKDVFIVGADITEFVENFKLPDAELIAGNLEANKIFSAFEDLDVPTVAAINGIALGGGLEMCLAADFRVMADSAKIGLPEVKLGIYPGFGGTVRLPRLIGVDNAVEWIASGKENRAEDALKVGAVDAVVTADKLGTAALDLITCAISGELDYKAKRTGSQLAVINRWFPSSKTCSSCGVIQESMPLSIREWRCPSCGAQHDRDVNAAKNIKKIGVIQLQEAPVQKEVKRVGKVNPTRKKVSA